VTRLPHIATTGPDARAPLNPRDRTLDRIAARRVQADHLIREGSAVLAAVSGGADSIALLHFLAAERTRTGHPASLSVGHVNHGLRGSDSDEDAAFVMRLSHRLGLPCFEETLPAGALRPGRTAPPDAGVEASSTSGGTLAPEDAARRLRYEALGRLATRAGASVIATGHTADDQAETVLFRMARGAGPRGLAGMASRAKVHGVRVIRPLLDVSREQVLAYLARHGIPHREDASNANLGAARNYLRHEILPRLERLNPGIRGALLRQSDLFREVDGYLEAEARRVLPLVTEAAEEGKIVLDARRLVSYPKLLRSYIFRCALHDLDGVAREMLAVHVDVLHSLATESSGRSADFPLGARVRRERGRIILTGRKQEPATGNLHPTVETSGIPADSRKGSPVE
jgi:tRNA(Ile)-lysidine synthase